jgi:hypothetical protein
VYRPRVDPCIFLHYNPGDWVDLLGEDFVKELLRRFRHVAADVDGLVRYAAENPEAFQLGLRGLRVGGRFGREWVLYVEGGFVDYPLFSPGFPGGLGIPGCSRDGAARRVDATPFASVYLDTTTPPGALAGGGAGASLPMCLETHPQIVN